MRKSFFELDSLFSEARVERGMHEPVWDEIAAVAMPSRGPVTLKKGVPHNTRHGPVFDNTCSLSATAFTNFLKGAIIPSQTDWLRIYPSPRVEENVKIRQLLDATSMRLLRAAAASNFYVQLPLTIRDDAVIGNGAALTEEKPPRERKNGATFSGFVFTSVTPARIWWVDGKDGRPDVTICQYELRAQAAFEWLGPDAPPGLYEIAKRDMAQKVTLVHFVYKNGTYDRDDPQDFPWLTLWACYDGYGGAGREAKSGGMDYNPYSVFRWNRVDGEAYARGQGHIARPNARGANMLMEMVLRAAPRDILAPLMMEEQANVSTRIGHNGVMVVRPPVKMAPQYLRSGANYQIAYDILEKDRAHIREAFFMQYLGNPETQPRSAEESRQIIFRGLQQMAAPSEMVAEDLGEVVNNMVTIMRNGRALPEFDEYLRYIGEEDEDDVCQVIFTSPFFAAQRQGTIERVNGFIAEARRDFAETGDPAWLDTIDEAAVGRLRSLRADVPADILRSDEAILERRRARATRDAKARALQVAQAAMGRGVGRMQPVGEAIPRGSPAATSDLEVLP